MGIERSRKRVMERELISGGELDSAPIRVGKKGGKQKRGTEERRRTREKNLCSEARQSAPSLHRQTAIDKSIGNAGWLQDKRERRREAACLKMDGWRDSSQCSDQR